MKDINNPDKFVETVFSSTIKIIDFGFSRSLEKEHKANTFIGNLNSMPKEVVNKSYDLSSEIWSIGIITFQLLTGETPFLVQNKEDLNKKLNNGTYSFSAKDKPSMEIIDFIQMLLQNDPTKRPDFSKIFDHEFLSGDPKTFKIYEFEKQERLTLSIFEKKQIVSYTEKEEMTKKIILEKSWPKSYNNNNFIEENYFQKKYENYNLEIEIMDKIYIDDNYYKD